MDDAPSGKDGRAGIRAQSTAFAAAVRFRFNVLTSVRKFRIVPTGVKGMEDGDLQFCWDDDKAASNLEKHGVSFEATTYVFDDSKRLEQLDEFSEGEYRNIVIGQVDGVLLTVVYSTPEENLYRIISARQATANERRIYEQNFIQS